MNKRSVAVTLSALIAVDTIASGVADQCWSLPRAASACAIPDPVMLHTEYPDAPFNPAVQSISVIASTGTMYLPF